MLRNRFVLPPNDAIELRAFTHGLMPRTVPAMMQHFVSDWQTYGVDAWNEIPNHWKPGSGDRVGWWSLPTYLGDQFIAPLLGAPAGTCIMQPNAHWIVQSLLSCPSIFEHRKKVILTEAEFPSVKFSLHQWQSVHDLELQILPLKDGKAPTMEILDAIDKNTGLVILSHVGFTTGERLTDSFLQRVAKRVHEVQGLLAIDGYHSIGAMTSSVVKLGVDIYFGGLLKEGAGSSGNAFLYLRSGLDLSPRTAGWFGDAEPFAFAGSPEPHPEVRRRFLGGTTAIASLYHAVEGVRILLDAGLNNVRKDSLDKTAYCIHLGNKAGLPLRSPREEKRRSAMAIFELPQADRMALFLKSHNIYTDSRQGKYLRMAPFVWNTIEEIEKAFEIIKLGLRGARYLQISPGTPAGPVT